MPLTLQELKSHLWNCAEILRGSAVDRTDWKAYILPLLFFKRICDVWDEETSDATKLYGDADPVDFPEVHRFNVPKECHWRDVRGSPTNVGAALSHAMREIERVNPDMLYRVFGAADWGNRKLDLEVGASRRSRGARRGSAAAARGPLRARRRRVLPAGAAGKGGDGAGGTAASSLESRAEACACIARRAHRPLSLFQP
jgi:hypothetical protein